MFLLGVFFPTGNPPEMGEIIGKMCDLLEPLGTNPSVGRQHWRSIAMLDERPRFFSPPVSSLRLPGGATTFDQEFSGKLAIYIYIYTIIIYIYIIIYMYNNIYIYIYNNIYYRYRYIMFYDVTYDTL